MDGSQPGDVRAGFAPRHAHLVGIADRGMSGLAQMLVQRGMTVSGTADTASPTVERLRQLGARVHAGHSVGFGPRLAQLVVYGPEVGREHPDRLSATRRGVPQASPAQWLGRLMAGHIGLAVAGRRDASVASAMIGWTLTRAGLDPTVVTGNTVPQLGGWARIGSGRHFIVEAVGGADELGPMGPKLALLLDVVCPRGADPARWADSVRRFTQSVPADGSILALERNQAVSAAVRGLTTPVEGVSLERGSAWWGADLREERGRFRFRAFHHGRFALEVRLQVPGRRNVLSALAAVAACARLDVPAPEIKSGLEEFAGVSRDFESRGSYRGVTLVDDEGRDPSAIAEALAVGRQVFGSRRLWAACITTSDWESDERGRLVAAFGAADHVLLIEEEATEGCETMVAELARALVAAGVQASRVVGLDDAIWELDRYLEPGDVLVTFGAGEVGTIADAFIRRLSRDRQGR